MDFAEKVKILAQTHHISINALRLEIGAGNGTLQGHGDPRFSTVVKVAKYFNVPLDYFLDDEEFSEPVENFILSPEERAIIERYRILEDTNKTFVANSLGIQRQDTGLQSSSRAG